MKERHGKRDVLKAKDHEKDIVTGKGCEKESLKKRKVVKPRAW